MLADVGEILGGKGGLDPMASLLGTCRIFRNRTVAGTSMQEGVTNSRQESSHRPRPEANREPAAGMATVNEEVNLDQDEDHTFLGRIEPSQRRPENMVDGLTASDTEDDEEALLALEDRRRAR